MAFDFSYEDEYSKNRGYDDLRKYIFFEVYDDYDQYHYFLINGKLVESDEHYDQNTAPRMYFVPMEKDTPKDLDMWYVPKEGCEHVVYLGNNPDILMNYLMEHPDGMETYIKYRHNRLK
jgi:hypothetical protein